MGLFFSKEHYSPWSLFVLSLAGIHLPLAYLMLQDLNLRSPVKIRFLQLCRFVRQVSRQVTVFRCPVRQDTRLTESTESLVSEGRFRTKKVCRAHKLYRRESRCPNYVRQARGDHPISLNFHQLNARISFKTFPSVFFSSEFQTLTA